MKMPEQTWVWPQTGTLFFFVENLFFKQCLQSFINSMKVQVCQAPHCAHCAWKELHNNLIHLEPELNNRHCLNTVSDYTT